MTAHKWRIYYGDGTEWTSEQGLLDAPSRDCQWIVIYQDEYPGYNHLCASDMYYYVEGEGWYGSDWTGFLDQCLMRVHQIDKLLWGRYMDNDDWQALKQRVEAHVDPIRKRLEHGSA